MKPQPVSGINASPFAPPIVPDLTDWTGVSTRFKITAGTRISDMLSESIALLKVFIIISWVNGSSIACLLRLHGPSAAAATNRGQEAKPFLAFSRNSHPGTIACKRRPKTAFRSGRSVATFFLFFTDFGNRVRETRTAAVKILREARAMYCNAGIFD